MKFIGSLFLAAEFVLLSTILSYIQKTIVSRNDYFGARRYNQVATFSLRCFENRTH